MRRLPDVIVLGSVVLRRYEKTNTWTCQKHWNILEYRKKVWRFDGGPLERKRGASSWETTPEEAYRKFLKLQLEYLKSTYKMERSVLLNELGNVGECTNTQ